VKSGFHQKLGDSNFKRASDFIVRKTGLIGQKMTETGDKINILKRVMTIRVVRASGRYA